MVATLATRVGSNLRTRTFRSYRENEYLDGRPSGEGRALISDSFLFGNGNIYNVDIEDVLTLWNYFIYT